MVDTPASAQPHGQQTTLDKKDDKTENVSDSILKFTDHSRDLDFRDEKRYDTKKGTMWLMQRDEEPIGTRARYKKGKGTDSIQSSPSELLP